MTLARRISFVNPHFCVTGSATTPASEDSALAAIPQLLCPPFLPLWPSTSALRPNLLPRPFRWHTASQVHAALGGHRPGQLLLAIWPPASSSDLVVPLKSG